MSAFNKRDRNDQEVTEEEKNVAQIKVQKSDKWTHKGAQW